MIEHPAIATVIQLAVAPVFLLAGVGAILNVMTQRLSRVIDRARALEDLLEAGEGPEETARHQRELAALSRRMRLVNGAITCCAAAALTVCTVVALLFLGDLLALGLGVPIAVLFVTTMALLIAGLSLLLLEISVAMGSVRFRTELLMNDARRAEAAAAAKAPPAATLRKDAC
ncbi:DUF2721 domain-containing protein [Parvularcula oceani]|uniref:DUF2721 domain-containing protein n=1 Tax=Parvularcula oceani TaxID=1247963 RepID=UPI0009DEC183|nr:DUF2721 domain-containing protein [Parvularcula oceani]